MSATHVIHFDVAVTLHEMDGTLDESIEIALDQVCAALNGGESTYGLPGDVEVTAREEYSGVREVPA